VDKPDRNPDAAARNKVVIRPSQWMYWNVHVDAWPTLVCGGHEYLSAGFSGAFQQRQKPRTSLGGQFTP
jgi:hypothetical protein